ncbi:uncharacterized protein LOC109810119 [Cajanus cajan]|uniref:uncharacterized protein LOC109810119 n=1 Tax=Cajanus cajan TaxID=3821 RepID=UPI00098DB384|nr:uncharacterized protein LOC109810119 [Cajanus cajan]
MKGSTISPSLISLCLSVWLLCATFGCANLLNQIEHCELDCASATVDGLNVVGNCEPKCSQGFTIPSQIEKQGQDAIKSYLDNLFTNALLDTASAETRHDPEPHPDSHAIETQSKTQINHEGERNIHADKTTYEVPKNIGEDYKPTIPSHIEKQGQEAMKEYLDNIFSNALFGSDSIETGQNREAHPDTYSIQLDTKTQIKHDGERSMDAHKSSYKVPKKSEEKQLLDGDFGVNVDLEIVDDGEYVLKIKKINLSSTDEDEVERAKHMAQNGAMLLLYGEMLQDMGEKLMAQSQTSIYSIFKMPTPPKLKSDN